MNILDKLGSLGAVVAAFGMSCCLPLFATVGSVIGLVFWLNTNTKCFM
jgi:hypothetical protein